MKILLSTGDAKIARFLKQGLEENGHDVQIADEDNPWLLTPGTTYNLLIYDEEFPEAFKNRQASGELRSVIAVSVLVITELNSSITPPKTEGNRVKYLMKPFEFKDLLALIDTFSVN